MENAVPELQGSPGVEWGGRIVAISRSTALVKFAGVFVRYWYPLF